MHWLLMSSLRTSRSCLREQPLTPEIPPVEAGSDPATDLSTGTSRGKKKPTLILNGDIFELALCATNDAAMAFERFIELVLKKGRELFDNRIIFVPGNHDHHLWETAREVQYADYYVKNLEPGCEIKKPWHYTKLFFDNNILVIP